MERKQELRHGTERHKGTLKLWQGGRAHKVLKRDAPGCTGGPVGAISASMHCRAWQEEGVEKKDSGCDMPR